MEYIGDVFYEYGTGLYANITNRCPDRCEFCIRYMTESLGTADSLWLRREPTMDEIKELLNEWDLNQFRELVFCGYGEPTERLSELLETAEYAKTLNPSIKVRINTNGLSDLINGCDTVKILGDAAMKDDPTTKLIDALNVSLNAKGAEEYLALCHPKFGLESYDAMLDFAKRISAVIPDVTMSVVSGSIPYEDIDVCRHIAEDEVGVKFRVR